MKPAKENEAATPSIVLAFLAKYPE